MTTSARGESLVAENAVRRRLQLLAGYLADLEQMQPEEPERYLADTVLRRALERTLQLALEASLDIGHAVIALARFRSPTDYRDTFAVLGEAGVIDARLALRLQDMAGFRNLLVHEYTRLDDRRVYEIIKSSLPDLAAYAEAIAAYVRL